MIRNKLGVFVKHPEPGTVKTRLVPPLSHEQAGVLYAAFLSDLFARLGRLRGADLTIFHDGGTPADYAAFLPAQANFDFTLQRGDSLGERLEHAFATLLAGGGRAAIIGSDSPDLPLRHIRRAFQKLKHKDVALGPASDGGYYLIGLRAPTPELFRGIPWSGPEVFAHTVRAIQAQGLSLALLPLWYDVDSAESLVMLRSMIRARRLAGGEPLPATQRALDSIPEE